MSGDAIFAGPAQWRWRRLLILPPLAFLLATFVAPSPPPPFDGPPRALLRAEPVMLDPADPGRRRVGALLFRRGWSLESGDRRFGGISAMGIEQGRVTALSDTGILFAFDLPLHPVQPMRLLALPQRRGEPKSAHDTEALLLGAGRAWVAFERSNRVARFDRDGWRLEAEQRPRPMRRWRSNSGPEAMVRLEDGRFLVFAEGGGRGRPSPVILFSGDPSEGGVEALSLSYRPPPGFRVTDAALLPDGRVLVLQRRFRLLGGTSARLSILDPADALAGTILAGREIAELAAPLTVDNMEALSVVEEEGRTIVRLASDNNFMAMQRTLLLEFALDTR